MLRLAQAELISGLASIVGPSRVSTATPERIAYSADLWPRAQIWKQGGELERYPPDAVCWPADEAQVADLLRFLDSHQIPVVPYGGGSGVCGGTVPLHGGVVVDLKRMADVVHIDRASMTVTAHAGINGQHLEDRLAAEGLTLGHFPSSIMCSTLGGWLAARSGGQLSSRYGKIEDMVLSCRVAFPALGLLDTADRRPGDPDWTQLVVGSEGTLGIVTEATLRVHPAPAARALRAFRFRTLSEGFRGMRGLMQAGLAPMVLRLYDPFDSLLAVGGEASSAGDAAASADRTGVLATLMGRQPPDNPGSRPVTAARRRGLVRRAGQQLEGLVERSKRTALTTALASPGLLNRLAHSTPSACLLIVGFEGTEEVARRDMWRARQLLGDLGGTDAGEQLGLRWLARRYHVSFKQSRLFQAGAFADTMEVATTWDRLGALHDAVRRAVTPHAFVMAHFSHAYREGCSIYFTFVAARREPDRAARLHEQLWADALGAAHGVGATASHHHGVGLAKRDAMPEEHGEMLRVWHALKGVVDPRGIMNPGKLFPDAHQRGAARAGGRADARAAREGAR